MTRSLCDQVAERLALGEALGELSAHATACPSCQGLVAVSSKLSASRHPVDPGLGFSARMTAGAQHRIAVRRRRRLAAGLAATVASGAFGVFVVTRSPEIETLRPPPSSASARPPDDSDREAPAAETEADEDLAALAALADVRRSSRLSARWADIERPLAPYKKLIKGVTP